MDTIVDLDKLTEGIVEVEAMSIAHDLGIEAARLLEALREGQLTGRCEQGIGEDAGRLRLTFFHANRGLRLIVDREGHILNRSAGRLRRPKGGQSLTCPAP
ncbi:MAG TPA: DUF6522 family protein [Steroidobacteraceae bacterium]|nr:DUF6522 family protein [Steroidobacteraceae bacterium]